MIDKNKKVGIIVVLKQWRKKAYFTQAELAEKLGIAQNTVSSWEHGRTIPDIITIEKLSVLLNVPLVDIINYFKTIVEQRAKEDEKNDSETAHNCSN